MFTRNPMQDPQPGDVLRDVTYNMHTKRLHEYSFVVIRRYVDSAAVMWLWMSGGVG